MQCAIASRLVQRAVGPFKWTPLDRFMLHDLRVTYSPSVLKSQLDPCLMTVTASVTEWYPMECVLLSLSSRRIALIFFACTLAPVSLGLSLLFSQSAYAVCNARLSTQEYKEEALALLLSPNQQAQKAEKSTYIHIHINTRHPKSILPHDIHQQHSSIEHTHPSDTSSICTRCLHHRLLRMVTQKRVKKPLV